MNAHVSLKLKYIYTKLIFEVNSITIVKLQDGILIPIDSRFRVLFLSSELGFALAHLHVQP